MAVQGDRKHELWRRFCCTSQHHNHALYHVKLRPSISTTVLTPFTTLFINSFSCVHTQSDYFNYVTIDISWLILQTSTNGWLYLILPNYKYMATDLILIVRHLSMWWLPSKFLTETPVYYGVFGFETPLQDFCTI